MVGVRLQSVMLRFLDLVPRFSAFRVAVTWMCINLNIRKFTISRIRHSLSARKFHISQSTFQAFKYSLLPQSKFVVLWVSAYQYQKRHESKNEIRTWCRDETGARVHNAHEDSTWIYNKYHRRISMQVWPRRSASARARAYSLQRIYLWLLYLYRERKLALKRC